MTTTTNILLPVVDRFNARQPDLLASFLADEAHTYYNYTELLERLLDIGLGLDDTKLVHELGGGDYQGRLVFVLSNGYDYWTASTYYGSCSYCDTLQAALEEPAEQRAKDLCTLCLHLVQSLREVA